MSNLESEIQKIAEHFEETARLKFDLIRHKESLALNKGLDLKPGLPNPITQILKNNKLIDHLEKISCSPDFYKLMYKSSSSTALHLINHKDMQDYLTGKGNPYRLKKLLFKEAVTAFHQAASNHAGYEFNTPDIKPHIPADKKLRKTLWGEYSDNKILTNIANEIMQHKLSEILNTGAHESAHSIHDQIRIGFLHTKEIPDALQPFRYDAAIYHLNEENNAYIPTELSHYAYETQAIEDIAHVTGSHFQETIKALMKHKNCLTKKPVLLKNQMN